MKIMQGRGFQRTVFLIFSAAVLISAVTAEERYWTIQCSDYAVYLCDGANLNELEVKSKINGDMVIWATFEKGLDYDSTEEIQAEPVPKMMGTSGFRIQISDHNHWFSIRKYYALFNGVPALFAESFGFGNSRDFFVDLDNDGTDELVCVCTYGQGGPTDVYVYQKRDDGIYCGTLDTSFVNKKLWEIPGNVWSDYNEESGKFMLYYPTGTMDNCQTAVRVTSGMEGLVFCKIYDGIISNR